MVAWWGSHGLVGSEAKRVERLEFRSFSRGGELDGVDRSGRHNSRASQFSHCSASVRPLHFTQLGKKHSFAGGEIEVEVDDVGAVVVAGRGAEVAGEARVEESVGGDAEGISIEAT